MNTRQLTIQRLAAAAVAGVLGLGAAAPAAAQPVPSYAARSADETIHGTIAAIDGKYAISVRDARGFVDNVTLRPGTIINPTGLELAPGQSVTILGVAQGKTFAANEIDTPYETLSVVPVSPAYGYYGYPYRPYGYRYGYGPAFGIGLRLGAVGLRYRG